MDTCIFEIGRKTCKALREKDCNGCSFYKSNRKWQIVKRVRKEGTKYFEVVRIDDK